MDVADQVEVAIHQRGVRLRFVDGVMNVEHGADRGAVDLAHDCGRLFERQDHVALVGRQRLHQDRDAAGAGMRRDAGQAVHEIARRLLAGERRR